MSFVRKAPLSLSCHVIFCEWTMSCGGIVTSWCHIGTTSFLRVISASFFCWLVVLVGPSSLAAELFLAAADSIDIFSAHWGCAFCLLSMLLSVVVGKPCMLWEFSEDCQTECSLVCTNTDSSSDTCFWFFSIPLHSTPFHFVPFCSTFSLRDSADSILLTSSPWFSSSSFLRPLLVLGQK